MRFLQTDVDDVRPMTNDEREQFEERAAILEFDAGMTRDAAEALAAEMMRKGEQLSLI